MESLANDLKHSVRLLLKSPGFSLAAIAVLSLGIGLNAGMFSVLHALVFRARPFAEPERLVQLHSHDAKRPGRYRAFSYAAYREVAGRTDVFGGVLAYNLTVVGVGEGGETRRSYSAIVSSNYFGVLGVPLAWGRAFGADEERPGSDVPVVVASHGFWKRTGFDPGLVGKAIRVNQRPFTVVGITPEGFSGTTMLLGPELYFPFGVFDSLTNDFFQGGVRRSLERAGTHDLLLVARLRAGLSREAALGAVKAVGASLEQALPIEQKDHALELGELPRIGGSASPAQQGPFGILAALLLGLTGCVLLVVCLNLAGLLLARGHARRKELAIRLALGGSRARIVRQLLTEGLVLAAAGGVLGVLIASGSTTLLVGSLEALLPVTIFFQAASPALSAATAGFCILATLFFALGPALRVSRRDVLADLQHHAGEDARAARRGRYLPRHPLVAAQLAVSLGVLIAAGLFVRLPLQAASLEPGFAALDTVIVEVDASLAGYDEAKSLDLYRRLEERLAEMPGVESASVGAFAPFGLRDMSKAVRRAGLTPAVETFDARWNAVGAGYFSALGQPLRRGRGFTAVEAGRPGAPAVAIVDEVLARKLWPAGDALGQRIQWAERDEQAAARPGAELEVVGIVGATRADGLEQEPRGAVYVPFAQGFLSNAHFHVRPRVESEAAAQALVEPVRRELGETAPGLPVFKVRTFRQHMRGSAGWWALRTSAVLFSTFGALTLLVAAVGVYGIQAYAVSRRTREIGVRMALGARPRVIEAMIVREGLLTTALAVVFGLALGAAAGRVLSAVIVDVPAFDGMTFAAAAAVMIAAALAASWIPARRATGTEPTAALRSE